MEPIFEAMVVTPELANRWIQQNIGCNRPISDARINQYVREMKAGRWKVTHQPIAFDVNDVLLDGQHRLRAVVEAGIPVKMMVAIGCDPATFNVVDTGGPRTATDLFVIAYKQKHGEAPSHSTWVTSIAVAMMRGVKGKVLKRDEIWAYALRHYEHIQWARAGLSRNKLMSSHVMAAFARYGWFVPKRQVLEPLMERLSTEMWCHEQDPLKALNARMVKSKLDEQRGHRLGELEKYAISINAIRAALRGQRMTKLIPSEVDVGESSEDRKVLCIVNKAAK